MADDSRMKERVGKAHFMAIFGRQRGRGK